MDDETLSHHERTGSEHDDKTPASQRGLFHGDLTLEDGELTVASQNQSALQETCLSLNGFPPNSTLLQASRKRSYPASQLSVQAPSRLSVRDKEPLSKVANVSGVSTNPFASTRANRESQAVKAILPSSLESQSACPSKGRD